MSVLNRLFRLSRANLHIGADILERAWGLEPGGLKEELYARGRREYERLAKEYNRYKEQFEEQNQAGGDYGRSGFRPGAESSPYSGVPQQVIDDLAVFGLKPPSSSEAVRKVWIREIKKYHPDKYMQDPQKQETSKQILQIYNTAYDRLRKYYKGRAGL